MFTPLRDGQALWSDEALGDDVRELLGVCSSVVSPAPLICGKSSPRDDPEDAAKDRADFDALTQP